MKTRDSEKRIVSSAVEESNRIDRLRINGINKEENMVYKIDNDVSDDQTPEEEESTTVATLSMDNKLKPSIDEPPDLELKILPKHMEYAFLEKNQNS